MRQIYLDYNATTPVAPSVCEALWPFLTEHFGNPSSIYPQGRACQQAVEDAREQVAALLGAQPDEVLFTSGGTESNNLAIKGVLETEHGYRGHVVMSAIEHPAVVQPVRFLEKMGCSVTVVPTDSEGLVDPSSVEAALRPDTGLVSIMHANNEIGSIQPIQQISQCCRAHGIPLHTDAAQSAGKIRVQVDELGVDLLSMAGHKLYAPKGAGALYVRRGTLIRPVQHGAGQEQGLRAGTENVASIVGLGSACRLAARGLDENGRRLARLRDRLENGLRRAVGAGLTRNGPVDARLPNTLSVNFPQVIGQELLARAPEICASTGAACHSGSTRLSATLAGLGLDERIARGTVRLSIGWMTSEEEIDRAVRALAAAWESLATSAG
jgi:cysteine desulfurase